jgi:hypothetical protein
MGEPSPVWVPGEAESEPGGLRAVATALRMMDDSITAWRRDPARGAKLAADASAIFGSGVLLALQDMQIEGTLPPPGTGAWDEFADQAEAGDAVLVLTVMVRDRESGRGRLPAGSEPDAEFRARLDRMVADAEARKVPGELPEASPLPPERSPPWEDDSAVQGLSRPGSLSESLRKMGLM